MDKQASLWEISQNEGEYPFYGGTPPHEPVLTSYLAAERITTEVNKLQAQVLDVIKECGDRGATDDEIERKLWMRHQTVSARRRELVLMGLVKESGETRATSSGRKANVWVVTCK